MSQAKKFNPRKKIRIGDLLVEQGVISDEQLGTALKEQKKSGQKLGRALVELGYIREKALLDILSTQLGIPLVDLKQYNFDPEIVKNLPETLARRYRAIVLSKQNGKFHVGMADPTDIFAYDEICKRLDLPVELAVVEERELIKAFDIVYRRTQEITSIAQELGEELSDADIDIDQLIATEDVSDAPVVRLLHSIFEDAVQVGASDIHIEPDEKVLRIRQRIDGVLYEQVMDEKRIANALLMRLKIMGGLDISEKRLPQDGRFNIRARGHNIDVRLSTMPIQHGESIVMRLLDQSGDMLNLDGLGMTERMLKLFRHAIHQPNGLVLVTGPTGSGKSTTLYSALKELNSPDKKIITAEDPVEYRLPRMNQVQVNAKIGLDFSHILRAALRQDPDVILIGEMRDIETVEIGLRAAMTGHLVLSTLHTNNALHTFERLLDMDAEGFLIASALRSIVSQQLLRKVCLSCKQPVKIEKHRQIWLEKVCEHNIKETEFVIGAGCPHCNNTGYSGRVGVFEIVEPDEEMLEAMRTNNINAFTESIKHNTSYIPMVEHGIQLAVDGITSIDEVVRITAQSAEVELPHGESFDVDDLT